MDARPIGVFDSGMGGLTVLHECLVTMPHEDFVYLGDARAAAVRAAAAAEIRRFAHEIGALPRGAGREADRRRLQRGDLGGAARAAGGARVPVVGVITPEAHAAVQATRNRRIGLLATEATVDGGPLRGARPHARRRRRGCTRSRARGSCR